MTTTWWRRDRAPSDLFVDYNQNARDHTIAAAYSVRGNPRGTVSAPITWDEVADVEPQDLTIATMPARFAALGDLRRGSTTPSSTWRACSSGLSATSETVPPTSEPEDSAKA